MARKMGEDVEVHLSIEALSLKSFACALNCLALTHTLGFWLSLAALSLSPLSLTCTLSLSLSLALCVV